MKDKNEIGGRDLTKFWLYMGAIALCVAALLYMLLSAKPHVAPAVKDSHGPTSHISLPAVPPALLQQA